MSKFEMRKDHRFGNVNIPKVKNIIPNETNKSVMGSFPIADIVSDTTNKNENLAKLQDLIKDIEKKNKKNKKNK
jgi:hypothetical protein